MWPLGAGLIGEIRLMPSCEMATKWIDFATQLLEDGFDFQSSGRLNIPKKRRLLRPSSSANNSQTVANVDKV